MQHIHITRTVRLVTAISLLLLSAVSAGAAAQGVLERISGDWLVSPSESGVYCEESGTPLSPILMDLVLRIDIQSKWVTLMGREGDKPHGLRIQAIREEATQAVLSLDEDVTLTAIPQTPERLKAHFKWPEQTEEERIVMLRYDADMPNHAIGSLLGLWLFDKGSTEYLYKSSLPTEAWQKQQKKLARVADGLRMDIKLAGKDKVAITFYENNTIREGFGRLEMYLEEGPPYAVTARSRWGFTTPYISLIHGLLYYNEAQDESAYAFRRVGRR